MKKKNINKTVILYLRSKSSYELRSIIENQPISFFLFRRLFRRLHSNVGYLSLMTALDFFYKESKYFFFIEVFQVYLYLEILANYTFYIGKGQKNVFHRTFIMKKHSYQIPIKELSLFLFFDQHRTLIRSQKPLFKVFKAYKIILTSLLRYHFFIKSLFVEFYKLYFILVGLIENLFFKRLNQKLVFAIQKNHYFFIGPLLKVTYIKDLLNEVCFFVRTVLKLSIKKNFYNIIFILKKKLAVYTNFLENLLGKQVNRNLNFQKVTFRLKCLGYSHRSKPCFESSLLLFIKSKLILTAIFVYYRFAFNKKQGFMQIIALFKQPL